VKVRGVGSGAGVRSDPSRLVPGQLVRGRVVARIGDDRFLVTIRGYLLDAASDLALEPGQRLSARVEVNGDRLLLRVQEEEIERDLPASALEDPEEIERVLKLLGHQPSLLDIREFQERLDRYRPYAGLPGLDPSDVWILAILWTRAIRSGADSFALTSYYLRAQPSPDSRGDIRFPDFDQILPFLQAEYRMNRTAEIAAIVENDSLIPGIEDRRAEAILLLNREEAVLGAYGEIIGAENLGCGLFRASKEAEERLIRLADHPVWPNFVIELECRQGSSGIKARILANSVQSRGDELAEVQKVWQGQAKSSEFALEELNWSETTDGEKLRGAFWRKWAEVPLYDRQA